MKNNEKELPKCKDSCKNLDCRKCKRIRETPEEMRERGEKYLDKLLKKRLAKHGWFNGPCEYEYDDGSNLYTFPVCIYCYRCPGCAIRFKYFNFEEYEGQELKYCECWSYDVSTVESFIRAILEIKSRF